MTDQLRAAGLPTTMTVGGKTFALAHVTAAQLIEVSKRSGLGLFLVIGGVLGFALSLLGVLNYMPQFWPALLVSVGIATWGVVMMAKHQRVYAIRVWTAGGGSNDLVSTDLRYLKTIHGQLLKAIELRGNT